MYFSFLFPLNSFLDTTFNPDCLKELNLFSSEDTPWLIAIAFLSAVVLTFVVYLGNDSWDRGKRKYKVIFFAHLCVHCVLIMLYQIIALQVFLNGTPVLQHSVDKSELECCANISY